MGVQKNAGVDKLIGKLCAFSILLFMLHECVYYNLYLYGNMDAALAKIDMNYSFNTALFVGQQGGLLKYFTLGVYFCLILAVFLYIRHYDIPKSLCFLWLFMVCLCVFTLVHSEDPFLYVTGITAFSGVMAPGTTLLISTAFLFVNERVWQAFIKGMKWVVILTFIVSIYGFLKFPYSYVGNSYVTRLYAFKWLKGPVGSLTMVLPFSFMFWNEKKCSFQKAVFLFAVVGAVMMQSRMSIISIMLIFAIMNYLCKKSDSVSVSAQRCIKQIYAIMIAVVALLFLTVIIDGIQSVLNINNRYLNLLLNRISDDTRSSQYLDHLPLVLKAQPFGIGYPSARVLKNYASYGIDNGLLMVMYYCGIPMVVTFIIFFFPHILNCLRKHNLTMADIAIITIGCCRLMWLFSSFSPSLSIGLLLLIVSVGRCYAIRYKQIGE